MERRRGWRWEMGLTGGARMAVREREGGRRWGGPVRPCWAGWEKERERGKVGWAGLVWGEKKEKIFFLSFFNSNLFE